MEYTKLNNPPIAVALFQLRYETDNFDFNQFDSRIRKYLPNRHENINVGIDFNKTNFPIGESPVLGKANAKIGSHLYYSKNQKTKIEISSSSFTYICEEQYEGWDNFKSEILKYLKIIEPELSNSKVSRISLRFINKFMFKEFDDPSKYFNILVTSVSDKNFYPLEQYGFRMIMNIPDSDIISIVNHNVENITDGNYIYIFDIDVIDRQNIFYDIQTIESTINNLRDVKDKIFFDTITSETIELCN